LFLGLAAELGYSQQTNVAAKRSGVHLTISMSRNVVAVGSTNFVRCCITNSSTNTIYVFDTGGPKYNFEYSLIDRSRKVYNLKPPLPPVVIFSNTLENIPRILPGGTHKSDLEIQVNKTVKPGRYKLEVKRRFLFATRKESVPPGWQEVVSNLLDLQVK